MSPLHIFIIALLIPTAYVIGSIPTGILVTQLFTGRDIRQMGSGNVGATNVRRVAGNRLGAMVLLGDMLKGFVPVCLAMQLPLFSGENRFWVLWVGLTALGAFFGHLYPVYLKCRGGGKGVATAAGCFLAISPAALAGSALVFMLVVWCKRVISLGSLASAVSLPVFLLFSGSSPLFSVFGAVVAVFIFIRHSGNIRRLREGTEPKV